jgi:hypothetical protein
MPQSITVEEPESPWDMHGMDGMGFHRFSSRAAEIHMFAGPCFSSTGRPRLPVQLPRLLRSPQSQFGADLRTYGRNALANAQAWRRTRSLKTRTTKMGMRVRPSIAFIGDREARGADCSSSSPLYLVARCWRAVACNQHRVP